MFKSINYSRVVCERCNAVTTILPGESFSKLNCTCDTDVPKPYKNITVWTDGKSTVEVLGEFDNGDFEIRHADGVLSYRIPHKTFIRDFKEVVKEPTKSVDIIGDMSDEDLVELALSRGIKKAKQMKRETILKRLDNGKD